MSLTVAVVEAKNVPNPESFGKSDPYAQIEFQGMIVTQITQCLIFCK